MRGGCRLLLWVRREPFSRPVSHSLSVGARLVLGEDVSYCVDMAPEGKGVDGFGGRFWRRVIAVWSCDSLHVKLF